MKHIIKVNNIQDAKDNPIRPLIAMDANKHLFFEGTTVIRRFVDLGLPSGRLWSQSLLGATNGNTAESWYGNYYAWGELEPNKTNEEGKIYFDWSNYKFGNDYNKLTKYCNNSEYGNERYTDELTQLVPEDDVATVTNSAWRMPTKEDFEELIEGTTNSWVTDYNGISGLNGRVFASKVNGNTLFIPAAGYRNGSDIYLTGSGCNLWSSSLDLNGPGSAYGVFFDSDDVSMGNGGRYGGCSVCPVLY